MYRFVLKKKKNHLNLPFTLLYWPSFRESMALNWEVGGLFSHLQHIIILNINCKLSFLHLFFHEMMQNTNFREYTKFAQDYFTI